MSETSAPGSSRPGHGQKPVGTLQLHWQCPGHHVGASEPLAHWFPVPGSQSAGGRPCGPSWPAVAAARRLAGSAGSPVPRPFALVKPLTWLSHRVLCCAPPSRRDPDRRDIGVWSWLSSFLPFHGSLSGGSPCVGIRTAADPAGHSLKRCFSVRCRGAYAASGCS